MCVRFAHLGSKAANEVPIGVCVWGGGVARARVLFGVEQREFRLSGRVRACPYCMHAAATLKHPSTQHTYARAHVHTHARMQALVRTHP